MKHCPNCGIKIASTFTYITPLSAQQTFIINEYSDNDSEGYCVKCGSDLLASTYPLWNEEVKTLTTRMQAFINKMPLVTMQPANNWEYVVLGIVTAQCVIGTGVMSELSSTFTDFFGKRSETYATKLREGELFCSTELRKQAIELGGDAIVATDIDYNELGGNKGMLMICMSGTAISIKNYEVISSDLAEKQSTIHTDYARLKHLTQHSTI